MEEAAAAASAGENGALSRLAAAEAALAAARESAAAAASRTALLRRISRPPLTGAHPLHPSFRDHEVARPDSFVQSVALTLRLHFFHVE